VSVHCGLVAESPSGNKKEYILLMFLKQELKFCCKHKEREPNMKKQGLVQEQGLVQALYRHIQSPFYYNAVNY